jgi:acetaldehyde dehydrogenase
MDKLKVAILGTGNIGTDLLMKIKRSPYLECSLFAGRNLNSPGSQFALERGYYVSDASINAIIQNPDCCDIVFDSTSASVHMKHAPILKGLGKFAIDLTPARVGRMCVPVINLEECLSLDNVNLITCGGQASIPVAYAISQAHPDTTYIEMVSTIASKSAGIGTRDNIDEFTQTTKEALAAFSGINQTKALITMNPAEPPINMRSTIYALIERPDMALIAEKVKEIVRRVHKYVPGYKTIVGPIYENHRVTTTVEVTGLGDYLPPYSGNLDIITCAAINIAEAYALKQLKKEEDHVR